MFGLLISLQMFMSFLLLDLSFQLYLSILMYFRVFWFVKYFFYFTFVEREFFVSYALPNDAQYKLC
jgi:hypothetical protein